jgi:hypothetical protein
LVSIEYKISSRFEYAIIEITKISTHSYGSKREIENGILLGIYDMGSSVSKGD